MEGSNFDHLRQRFSRSFRFVHRGLSLQVPYFFVSANLINRKIQGDDSISYTAIFAPLLVLQATSSIPSIIILLSRTDSEIISSGQYRRIVARRTIYNSVLRAFFFGLLIAKLEGSLTWSYRLITVPIWLQLLVVMVMLHTEIRQLQDPAFERAFKKQSASIEIQLLASVFIAMKLDEVVSWSWLAVFWPLWLPAGMVCLVALLLTCFMPCFLCVVVRDRERRLSAQGHPALMVAMWTGFLFCAICSFVFLLHLGRHLDGHASVSTDDFMVPLYVLLVFFLVVELYLFVFGMGVLQRLAQQHQQMMAGAAARGMGDGPASAEEAEARTNAVINGEKPRLLVRIATDVYRKGREDEERLLQAFKELEKRKTQGEAAAGAETGAGDGAGEEAGFVQVVWETEEEGGQEPSKCVVCWEGERETVLLECGHGCCCFVCARRVIMDGQPCPMCRAPIGQVALVDHSKASDIPMASLIELAAELEESAERETQGRECRIAIDDGASKSEAQNLQGQANGTQDLEMSADEGALVLAASREEQVTCPASPSVASPALCPAPRYTEPACGGHRQPFSRGSPSPSPSPPSEGVHRLRWEGGGAGEEGAGSGDEAAERREEAPEAGDVSAAGGREGPMADARLPSEEEGEVRPPAEEGEATVTEKVTAPQEITCQVTCQSSSSEEGKASAGSELSGAQTEDSASNSASTTVQHEEKTAEDGRQQGE